MIKLSVAELATVLGLDPPATGGESLVTKIVVDSRLVEPGAAFIAFDGERVDGHDFVEQAFAQGAVVAVTGRVIASGPCLVVSDPQRAVGQIGRHVVQVAKRGGLRVLGITGSQGKTSTKDLLAQIVEHVAPTIAPRGSLNNELGLPLTATGVDESTRYLIAEMGARGIGHITYLCELTPPDVGVVLNVGQAHLGEFGSQEAIAQAKGELVEALSPTGTAVLNADDPLVWAMRDRTRASVLTFSVNDDSDADVRATEIVSDDLGRYRFRLVMGQQDADVQLQLIGRHQVANAVAAAAAASALDIPVTAIAASLSAAGLRSRWRMEVDERSDGVVIVNDAYNANPDSMRAALGSLAELGGGHRRRYPQARTWAVLGEMAELGDGSRAAHEEIGRIAATLGISRVLAVGQAAISISDGAQSAGADAFHVEDQAAALALLEKQLQPGDVVLVKASRAIALETLATALLADESGEEPR